MWRGLKTARCERCDRGGGETQMRSCFITVRTVGGRRGGGGIERPTERPQSGWRGVSVQTLKETDRKTRCIDLKSRESAFSSPSILAQAVGICTQTVHVTVATSVLLRPIQRGGESLSNRWPSDSIANNFSWLSRAAPSVPCPHPPPTPYLHLIHHGEMVLSNILPLRLMNSILVGPSGTSHIAHVLPLSE